MEQEMVTVTRREWDEKIEQVKLNTVLVGDVKEIKETLKETCNNGGCNALKGFKGTMNGFKDSLDAHGKVIYFVLIPLLLGILGLGIWNHLNNTSSSQTNQANFNSAAQSNQAGFNDLHQDYNGTERMKK
jgi:hypothetical protein